MIDKRFVDTNILLYARDSSEKNKQSLAESLLRELWEEQSGCLSIQVLNEYYVNVTQKLKPGLSEEEAWSDIQALSVWNPIPLDYKLIEKGYHIQKHYRLSWWDSLIVSAAVLSDCVEILSEDLSMGQMYEGISVVNPFAKSG